MIIIIIWWSRARIEFYLRINHFLSTYRIYNSFSFQFILNITCSWWTIWFILVSFYNCFVCAQNNTRINIENCFSHSSIMRYKAIHRDWKKKRMKKNEKKILFALTHNPIHCERNIICLTNGLNTRRRRQQRRGTIFTSKASSYKCYVQHTPHNIYAIQYMHTDETPPIPYSIHNTNNRSYIGKQPKLKNIYTNGVTLQNRLRCTSMCWDYFSLKTDSVLYVWYFFLFFSIYISLLISLISFFSSFSVAFTNWYDFFFKTQFVVFFLNRNCLLYL